MALFAGICGQGLLGWYMVRSGKIHPKLYSGYLSLGTIYTIDISE